jgi:hypothetical protein
VNATDRQDVATHGATLLLKAVFLLLFRPREFERLAEEHGAKEQQRAPRRERTRIQTSGRTVREGLVMSLLLVLAAILAGWFTGRLLDSWYGPAPSAANAGLQFVGIGILLWATLGKQGWNLQTWGSRTLPELVDRWVYRVLYVAGSYALLLTVSWPAQ